MSCGDHWGWFGLTAKIFVCSGVVSRGKQGTWGKRKKWDGTEKRTPNSRGCKKKAPDAQIPETPDSVGYEREAKAAEGTVRGLWT